MVDVIWLWVQIVKVARWVLCHWQGGSACVLSRRPEVLLRLNVDPFIKILVLTPVHIWGWGLHNYFFIFKWTFMVNSAFFVISQLLGYELNFLIYLWINDIIFASKKSCVSRLLMHVWNSIFSIVLIALSVIEISSQAISLRTDHKISQLQLAVFIIFINYFLTFFILVLVRNASAGRWKFPEICIFNMLTGLFILLILSLLNRAAVTCFLHTRRWL